MKKLGISVRGKVSSFIRRDATISVPIFYFLFGQMTSVRVVEPATAALDPSSSPSGRRVKKEKYTLASLPFPCGAESMTYTREWRKSFKPTIIHWAATLKDPFGTNAVVGEIVKEVWSTVFPTIANEVVVGSQSRHVIIHLVSSYFTHKLD